MKYGFTSSIVNDEACSLLKISLYFWVFERLMIEWSYQSSYIFLNCLQIKRNFFLVELRKILKNHSFIITFKNPQIPLFWLSQRLSCILLSVLYSFLIEKYFAEKELLCQVGRFSASIIKHVFVGWRMIVVIMIWS